MITRLVRRRALGVAVGIALAGTLLAQSPAPSAAQEEPPCDQPETAPEDNEPQRWVIDANTLRVDDPQETRRRRRYDEIYIANVAFVSTLGEAGSTEVWVPGNRYKISSGPAGRVHEIRDEMGQVGFSGVGLRTVEDVLAGRNPQLVGTFTIMFEQDRTPSRFITDILQDVRQAAESEIAGIVEPLSITAIDDEQLAADVEAAAERIEDEALPSLGRRIRIAFRSLFNPDDLIDFRVNLFGAVAPDEPESILPALAEPMCDALTGAVDDGTGVAGLLRSREYSQRFRGSDATYTVDYVVAPVGPEAPPM